MVCPEYPPGTSRKVLWTLSVPMRTILVWVIHRGGDAINPQTTIEKPSAELKTRLDRCPLTGTSLDDIQAMVADLGRDCAAKARLVYLRPVRRPRPPLG